MTVQDLARAARFHPVTIKRFLRGDKVGLHTAARIGAELGLSLDFDPLPERLPIVEGSADLAPVVPANRAALNPASAPAFELFIDPILSPSQVTEAVDALAEFFRTAGGVGLTIESENQEAHVLERVDA